MDAREFARGVAQGVLVAVLGGATVAGLAWAADRWRKSKNPPQWDQFFEEIGAPEQLRALGRVQRWTESRGNPRTGLGLIELFPSGTQPRRSASRESQIRESQAAADAYDSSPWTRESPIPRSFWVFGSGGPYGAIPTYALYPWKGTAALRAGRVGPLDVFHPRRATFQFVDTVRRLTERSEWRQLPADQRNLLAIKRGLARPSLMADHLEEHQRSRIVTANAREGADAMGVPWSSLIEPVALQWSNYRPPREVVT